MAGKCLCCVSGRNEDGGDSVPCPRARCNNNSKVGTVPTGGAVKCHAAQSTFSLVRSGPSHRGTNQSPRLHQNAITTAIGFLLLLDRSGLFLFCDALVVARRFFLWKLIEIVVVRARDDMAADDVAAVAAAASPPAVRLLVLLLARNQQSPRRRDGSCICCSGSHRSRSSTGGWYRVDGPQQ
jgi:hypothetical protein